MVINISMLFWIVLLLQLNLLRSCFHRPRLCTQSSCLDGRKIQAADARNVGNRRVMWAECGEHLGRMWGTSGLNVGPIWAQCGPHLGYLGNIWAPSGLSGQHLGPIWAPSGLSGQHLGYLGNIWAIWATSGLSGLDMGGYLGWMWGKSGLSGLDLG